MIAKGVGDIWNKIMGFKIPIIDQTIFEVLISYLLGGPLNTIIGTILQKLVTPIIDNLITQAILIAIFKT